MDNWRGGSVPLVWPLLPHLAVAVESAMDYLTHQKRPNHAVELTAACLVFHVSSS